MLSIITCLYNQLNHTRAFAESLRKFPPAGEWEMLWVDNGSTDGTSEWLADMRQGEMHRVHINKNNLGYARGNNFAAQKARGEILVFINNDVLLTQNWAEPMRAALGQVSNVGLAGNIQLRPQDNRIDHAGITFDLIGSPDHLLKGAKPGRCKKTEGRFCQAVTAACCMVKKEVFHAAGGFDESFRNGCEDVDLCLRLGRMGYRHWVDYRSVIYHHVSSSPGRKDHEDKNQALFLKRWGHLTSRWGQEDWPRNYLSKHLRCPWKLNGTKTVDALMRLAGLKHGDSEWARRKREAFQAHLPTEEADASEFRG